MKKKNKALWMWLIVALIALTAFLLVDFNRYSNQIPSDEDIDAIGEDNNQEALKVESDLDGEISDFVE